MNKRNKPEHVVWAFFLLIFLLTSCQSENCTIEPCLFYIPNQPQIEALSTAFPPLTKEELQREWGRQLYLGARFACDMDFYRAITDFRQALYLIPKSETARRHQIEFSILQCYYLGQKYQDAVLYYESSTLREVFPTFPAYKELLIMMADAYSRSSTPDQAEPFRCILEKFDEKASADMKLYDALSEANFTELSTTYGSDDMRVFLYEYDSETKSVKTAETLNAILPGAGYLYVGQKKTALTSFLINALFIGASYYFFDQGNYPAGAIVASLETGWYFGGINGAGLAAKEYNESIYNNKAKEYMIKNRLFPVLMLEKSF